MKICRFNDNRVGEVVGDRVFDLGSLAERPPGLVREGDALILALESLKATPEAERRRGPDYALAAVTLRSPVAAPGKMVAAPVNYLKHVAEASADPAVVHGHTQTDIGLAGLFLKANSSLCGPSDGVRVRFPARRTDYEVELAVVIGAAGTAIPIERALEHVAGYCIGLDITLRGPEDRSFRKSIDTYSVLGPWITTADEVPNPGDLDLRLDQNGVPRQVANTREMVYGVAKLIEFASAFFTLHPGDVIFTGTPDGVGPIHGGDVLRAEISGLGEMHVRVEYA